LTLGGRSVKRAAVVAGLRTLRNDGVGTHGISRAVSASVVAQANQAISRP
jgi:hypothetical protein